MQNDIIKIKNYLTENGITYEELSKRSNISLNTLKCIFSGRTPNPRIDTVRAITNALGMQEEKQTLAQQVVDATLANLNIADYNLLTPAERQQVANVFNAVVSAIKSKQ